MKTIISTLLLALVAMIVMSTPAFSQPGTTYDSTGTGAISRQSFKDYKINMMKFVRGKHAEDSTKIADLEKRVAALEAGSKSTTPSTPTAPATVAPTTVVFDSASFATVLPLLDKRYYTKDKMNRTFMHMKDSVGGKITVVGTIHEMQRLFAAQLDSLKKGYGVDTSINSRLAYMEDVLFDSTTGLNTRMNDAENSIAGLSTKVDLASKMAWEAYSVAYDGAEVLTSEEVDVDKDDHTPEQQQAFENLQKRVADRRAKTAPNACAPGNNAKAAF